MHNRVWLLPANENWICDRFVNEWSIDNQDITVKDPMSANVIWLLSDWRWKELPYQFLKQKRVITSIHHIVPEKFGPNERYDFQMRDDITDVYHAANHHTAEFISKLTTKRIVTIPFWANQKIWYKTDDIINLRKKYNVPNDVFLIGSFQRDTEGNDLTSPKLEKGPDLFIKACDKLQKLGKNEFKLEVILAGWRRQYVMKKLDDLGIEYHYFERPEQNVINDLYQMLNLYPITSRVEGGPQALIECGLLDVPVVSRNVGIADIVLPQEAINDDVTLAKPHIPNVDFLKLPQGYNEFRKLIDEL